MTSHYEFLQSLHQLLQPRGYLEIGVQSGASLSLATCPAVGVDPAGMGRSPRSNERLYAISSDEFFAGAMDVGPIDLVYIDGMHLFEYALRDLMGALRLGNEKTVYVFDDVLPYSPLIAGRVPVEGDWTGDVWKIIQILDWETTAEMCCVDVWPTGALVAWDFGEDTLPYLVENYEKITCDHYDNQMPDWVLDRQLASTPDHVLGKLRNR